MMFIVDTVLMIFLFDIFAINVEGTSMESRNNEIQKLLILQKSTEDDNGILVMVKWSQNTEEILDGCKIYRRKDLINRVLESSKDSPIKTLSEDEMQSIMDDCKEFNLRNATYKNVGKRDTSLIEDNKIDPTEPQITDGYNGLPIIFPGTKWCGSGDTADSYEDLGTYEEVDRCCRDHDHCDDTLIAGESRGGLINTSWFTALSCKCDQVFYQCLSQANTIQSNAVLNLYFNILQRKCFELDYPLTEKCKRYATFLKIKCLEYDKNTTAPKVYQWFPAKKHINVPVPEPFSTTEPI